MDPLSHLLLVAGFQLKHFVCDGPLQTAAMVESKGKFMQPLGLLHAGLHGLGTFCVVLVWGGGIGLCLFLAVLDFVAHYAIDFTKENIVRKSGWTFKDAYFWWSIAADQFLHHLSYLAMTAYIVTR